MSSSPPTDMRLESEVADALRGASDLRDHLLIRMASGNPSVNDLAYTIKIRVKEDYKISDKVALKREKRPAYGVQDVRDIVGVRVVTLYRLDAITVIPLLLDLIQSDAESGPFKKDSLEEIIIYSTNPQGDPQGLATQLLDLFKSRGLGSIARIDEQPSNYTSIHMVAWGRGKYRDMLRDIPVEIQVRTGFEDIWGEIDHSLKYKRRRASAAGGEPDSATAAQITAALSHLNVMKTLIDGVAQYADQIKLQIAELDRDRVRSDLTRSADEPLTRLRPLRDLSEAIKARLSAAFANVQPALEGSRGKDLSERIDQLHKGLAEFADVEALIADTAGLSAKTLRETDYMISMQRALILFELGNTQDHGAPQLAAAVRIYADMSAKFPARLVVHYRHAKALDALGSRPAAIELLRDVVQRLANPRETLPKRHWIRASAPRILGVLLWEEATVLQRSKSDSRRSSSNRAFDLLSEAVAVTRAGYETRVSEEVHHQPSERAKSANNLLYYALDLVPLSRALDKPIEAAVAPEALNQYLADMGAEDPGTMSDMRLLDTVMRVYELVKDAGRAKQAATRLIEVAEQAVSGTAADRLEAAELTMAARSILAAPVQPTGK